MANGESLPGQTPVSPEEAAALRVSLQSREELNAFERENILEARAWALAPRTLRRDDLLTEKFIRDLHRRMFGRVWRWAGRFRTTERNLGRPVPAIIPDVRTLLDDARYWQEHQTYPVIEAAVRFHHRLVCIHPWVNGNGRHARLMADLLVCAQGGSPLSWGRNKDLVAPSDVRAQYLAALRAADATEFGPLLAFVSGSA
jgi:Fic-DOC domain mobile mystery protein B